MYITNVGNPEELHSIVVKQLRDFGIKHRHKKIGNVIKHSGASKGGTLFNKPLNHLPTEAAAFKGEAAIEIPTFIFDACSCLRQNVETEGIFRKGGSAARQKEIKASLDQGKRLGHQHHEIDVANILKHFLRELPEPLIPYAYHETLLRCLLLKEKKVDGLLLVCLLLPATNLNTLAYLMGFLSEIASHSKMNKMDVTNLSIVISPSVMPIGEKMTVNSGARLNNHVQIVELLIRNADQIGVVSESLCEKVTAGNSIRQSNEDLEKNEDNVSKQSIRKKRRSGSLTRMLNGFKKMVGRTVESDDSGDACTPAANASTPCIKAAAKRRGLHTGAFSAKKKREVLKALPQRLALASTPQTPLCSDNCELYHHTPGVCGHPDPRKTKTPATKSHHRRFFSPKPDRGDEEVQEETQKKPSRLSFRGRRRTKKQKHEEASSFVSDVSGCSDNPGLSEHHKWGAGIWGRRKPHAKTSPSMEDVSSEVKEDSPCLPFIEEADVNLSDDDRRRETFVRIPKSEYEAIKNRVSAIENRISREFDNVAEEGNADLVQTAYERTLESSTSLDRSTTDRLARRLSRDLKIRRSAGERVVRSPSARRIGSLRRRSRELTRSLSWQPPSRGGLRRGRPNTVQTGLPHDSRARLFLRPDEEDASVCASLEPLAFLPFYHRSSDQGPLTRSRVRHASSFHGLDHSIRFQDVKRANSQGYLDPAPDPTKRDAGEGETWQNAESFFHSERYLQEKLAQTKRASIVKLLNENAGIVSERLKLFDLRGENRTSKPKASRVVAHSRRTPSGNPHHKQLVRQAGTHSARAGPKKIGSPRRHLGGSKENARVSLSPRHPAPPPTSVSPLKDRNRSTPRDMPYIKRPLMTASPRQRRHPPSSATLSTGRRANTPMRAIAPFATPVRSPGRQSPRLLLLKAKNISKMY